MSLSHPLSRLPYLPMGYSEKIVANRTRRIFHIFSAATLQVIQVNLDKVCAKALFALAPPTYWKSLTSKPEFNLFRATDLCQWFHDGCYHYGFLHTAKLIDIKHPIPLRLHDLDLADKQLLGQLVRLLSHQKYTHNHFSVSKYDNLEALKGACEDVTIEGETLVIPKDKVLLFRQYLLP